MDPTSLWTLTKLHRKILGNSVVVVLVFIAGWQVGRVMSPYYATQPIVFEEQQCDTTANPGGTREELISLQEEGREQGAPTISPSAPPEQPEQTQEAIAGTTTEAKEFVGSVNSDLYHHPDCAAARRIKEENKVWFASVEDAQAAGYSPSKCTQEKVGQQ